MDEKKSQIGDLLSIFHRMEGNDKVFTEEEIINYRMEEKK